MTGFARLTVCYTIIMLCAAPLWGKTPVVERNRETALRQLRDNAKDTMNQCGDKQGNAGFTMYAKR